VARPEANSDAGASGCFAADSRKTLCTSQHAPIQLNCVPENLNLSILPVSNHLHFNRVRRDQGLHPGILSLCFLHCLPACALNPHPTLSYRRTLNATPETANFQLYEVVRVKRSSATDQKDLLDLLGSAGMRANSLSPAASTGGLPTTIKVPTFEVSPDVVIIISKAKNNY